MKKNILLLGFVSFVWYFAFVVVHAEDNGSSGANPQISSDAAANSTNVNSTDQAPSPSSSAMEKTLSSKSGKLTEKELTFAKKAAMGGMLEVDLGKVAEKNASSTAVKNFGAQMVTDHGKANAQLQQIAAQKGISLPTKLDAEHQSTVDKLSAMKGKKFDTAYVNDMVEDHEKDLAEFQKAAAHCHDPELKAFAQQTSVVIEHHLHMIKKIQSEMNKQ